MKVMLLVAAFAAIAVGSRHGWMGLTVGGVVAGVLVGLRDGLIERDRR